MEFLVTNRVDDGSTTLGKMYIQGIFECFTLEPSINATFPRIPSGRYPLRIRLSPRFNENVLQICNVPGREYIEIHPGNKAQDTEGCTCVGKTEARDWIGSSRDAFTALMSKVYKYSTLDMWITFDEAKQI